MPTRVPGDTDRQIIVNLQFYMVLVPHKCFLNLLKYLGMFIILGEHDYFTALIYLLASEGCLRVHSSLVCVYSASVHLIKGCLFV